MLLPIKTVEGGKASFKANVTIVEIRVIVQLTDYSRNINVLPRGIPGKEIQES